MPSDAELKALFHRADGPASSLDPAAIIRRSKRKRLPRQLSAGSVLTLAAAGIGVAGVTGVGGLNFMGVRTASDLAESAADAPGWVGANSSPDGPGADGPGADADAGRNTPYIGEGDEAAPCGTAQAPPSNNPWRIRLEVNVASKAAGADSLVTATITIRNNGSAAAEVTPVGPVVHTLQRDGVVVAIGSGELLGMDGAPFTEPLNLGAGQSTTLQSEFALATCLSVHPGVPAGDYLLGTQLGFESDTGTTAIIDGTLTDITVR